MTQYLLIAMVIIGLGSGWVGYEAGHKAGSAELQVQWDADKAQIQKAADMALAAVTAEKEKALAENNAIQTTYQGQLAAAQSDTADMAIRLRSLETRIAAGSHDLPKTASGSGSTNAAPEPSQDGLNAVLSDRLTECAANESQLAALISEIKPQLQANP